MIKYLLELCNQEGFKTSEDILREYNIKVLGC